MLYVLFVMNEVLNKYSNSRDLNEFDKEIELVEKTYRESMKKVHDTLEEFLKKEYIDRWVRFSEFYANQNYRGYYLISDLKLDNDMKTVIIKFNRIAKITGDFEKPTSICFEKSFSDLTHRFDNYKELKTIEQQDLLSIVMDYLYR